MRAGWFFITSPNLKQLNNLSSRHSNFLPMPWPKPENEIHRYRIEGLNVVVTRKKIKHGYIRIDSKTLDVLVSIPVKTDREDVEFLVRSRANWIKQKQAAAVEYEKRNNKTFVDGERHRVWGADVSIINRFGAGRRRIVLTQEHLAIITPNQISLAQKQKLLGDWYANEVRIVGAELIDQWAPVLQVTPGRLFVQKMKSKWGSCNTQTANIRINSELAKFPKAALEHVVVHELVHLLEPSHSNRFYSLMDQFLPYWRESKALMSAM